VLPTFRCAIRHCRALTSYDPRAASPFCDARFRPAEASKSKSYDGAPVPLPAELKASAPDGGASATGPVHSYRRSGVTAMPTITTTTSAAAPLVHIQRMSASPSEGAMVTPGRTPNYHA
jgi:hypothetical protein